jgi:hypothetical protein
MSEFTPKNRQVFFITPLARDELTGPRGEGYRRMIGASAAGRGGTPDEVGTVGALLMGRTVLLLRAAISSWMEALRPLSGTANSLQSEP